MRYSVVASKVNPEQLELWRHSVLPPLDPRKRVGCVCLAPSGTRNPMPDLALILMRDGKKHTLATRVSGIVTPSESILALGTIVENGSYCVNSTTDKLFVGDLFLVLPLEAK